MPVIYVPGPPGGQGERGIPGNNISIPVPTVPGPIGGQGYPGPQGVPGIPSNVPGPQGVPGIQGIQGIPGNTITIPGQPIPGPVGAKGDKGDIGPQGIQGIQGEAARERLIYHQQIPSNIWIINHTMNSYPAVSIIDTGGNIVEGDIQYTSLSQVVLSFTSPFSGIAVLT